VNCSCGHSAEEHIFLPGHPDGAQECQAEECDCGLFRKEERVVWLT